MILRQAAPVPSQGLLFSTRTERVLCDDDVRYVVLRMKLRGVNSVVTAPSAKAAVSARRKIRRDPAWLDFIDGIDVVPSSACRKGNK